MLELTGTFRRRTTTDAVFDQLHEEIVSLKILPGSKLSEADVAQRFSVSRQPVRDAFARLGNQDLLLIRPQRATEVRGFSMESINRARFVRLAVELEVVRCACALWDEQRAATLGQNLDQQQQMIEADEAEQFHALDYKFHKLICELGDIQLAFETIKDCKHKIDRLCILSLGRDDEAAHILAEHKELAEALKNKSADAATAVIRRHLRRLDATIADIHRNYPEYFEA